MPTEDFRTYTEVDPATYLSQTENRSTFVNFDRDITSYLWDDKGLNHFSGDFEHLIDIFVSKAVYTSMTAIWALTNDLNDLQNISALDGDWLAIILSGQNTTPEQFIIYIWECDGGSFYLGGAGNLNAINTPYYLRIKRVEADSTFGTLYLEVYTSSADRENKENVRYSYSLDLHSSKKDFQFNHSPISYNSEMNGRDMSGYGENLDLAPFVLHELEITEGIDVGEAVDRWLHKVASEGIVIGEVISKLTTKAPFIEGIAIGELVATARHKALEIIEGIAIGEAVSKLTHKVHAEGIAIGEIVFRGFELVITEGIAIGEAVSKLTHKVHAEGIAIGEIVFRGFELVITEGIAIGEVLVKMRVIQAIRTLRPFRVLDAIRNKLKDRQL